ncbi:nitrogen regulation protein NR(II) [Thalassotalea sp. M1531]|uniref:Sensory histidine kinase/phosphatase NtrB n=1 Tax=Thalassotalea algicola TaxID=2716224 RepID=A0A7Y0Q7Z0_9GAMM|nr:nitrogen regulation protein NR(II) [Thalassotalea algicola]NMP33589.1 nitrogen regulation protein NR(II) [Thalassotalea algicola]
MYNRTDLFKHKAIYQQQLANQLVTAVIVLDEKLTIQYLNPSAEALLGKSYRRLFNLAFDDVFPNSTIGAIRLQQVIESGQEFNDSDVSIQLGDHYTFTAEVTASATEFNQQPHILLELKQIDQQKQISAEAFQQQQWESARDLIRGLAHEIKNPLGGLRGAAQLLTKELNSEQQEYTSMIIEQADRLRNLVDRLLGPNQLPKMEVQNIHIVLEKVTQLVSFDNEKNIQVIRDYDPSIPDIAFDADKVQQAILNIVNNAIQAIEPESEITLKTRVASNQTINGQRVKLSIMLSIIDRGPGIPEDIQDTLFYPMVSGRSNGTGLGLSISQTLIHQHHGKLSCKSRPGRTEFTILLPISDETKL